MTTARNPLEQQRRELVSHLQRRGIRDERVLQAIASVPRERFIPASMRGRAYEDSALPIDQLQTISQPYTVASMTEALRLSAGDKVLEIGTGSGYQAAVLSAMGMQVFTIERHLNLSQQARGVLTSLGYTTIQFRVGDGTIGWSEHAPYDGIIVTAGAPDVPQTLAKQLKIGGRLVIPVGDRTMQRLYRITRTDEADWSGEDLGEYKFVPLIGREGWSDSAR